ncbi:nuclear transport factor 2 family protein [Rhizobium leguminosarum]|jgi:ketosteroid isomerase-like protein|uniref:nuclear transport factor 2 family protein n=1 Tax=Rhizobium leguminosarum TaxID=384 RepID=UPI001A9214CE|nr:nuclear transport factor 2 family protein [Rhizobium leguminosarum]MBY5552353.1 nuclear transport factor 2 family protein [Rhizobium leguminosarum]MBY5634181.1 nuclear transport factor 2 family protein [Rhizobium leguminosarum]MBY5689502.1 nuclear transport factor 2 family protein [Rhizobium leguminosarum]MBY5724133.1 nuclear transport factor 2 family protein [Rhizobium leguminosarum]MBY5743361.1 nuclear transport factor 2 family protein [Rhizobium leguminosarum]
MSIIATATVGSPAPFVRRIFNAALGIAATILALSGMEVRAAPHALTETERRNKAAVEAGFEAWAAGTGSPYELLADDARWTIEGYSLASKTYPSREAFLREVIRPFNARMKAPLKPAIRNVYVDGDTVIVFFDARGIARDGEPYANTYAWFLDMRDGRIVRASAFFDSVVFNAFWSRVTPAD